MNRHARWAAGVIGAVVAAAGCHCAGTVRESAIPDAEKVHAEAPTLLPSMPLAGTGPTRGQAPEQPRPGVTTTSATSNGSMPPAPGQVAVRIRAHVNGQPILDDELREAMVMRAAEMSRMTETQRVAFAQELASKELERLIERELILQDALFKIKELKKPQILEELKREAEKDADRRIADIKKNTKHTDDAEFRAFMAKAGLTVDGIRRQTERNFMVTEYVRNLIVPTIQRMSLRQIKDYYDDHPEHFTVSDRVKWLDLFVDASRFPTPADARRHAELIAQRARAGEDFAALVKQHDHGDSSLRHGEGLGQKPGEIRPVLVEPVVLALKPGEVGPVIDVGFGYHIVKVVEREYAGREPFDEKTQAKAKDKLRGAIAEREYKRIVEDLKRRATIVIYPN